MWEWWSKVRRQRRKRADDSFSPRVRLSFFACHDSVWCHWGIPSKCVSLLIPLARERSAIRKKAASQKKKGRRWRKRDPQRTVPLAQFITGEAIGQDNGLKIAVLFHKICPRILTYGPVLESLNCGSGQQGGMQGIRKYASNFFLFALALMNALAASNNFFFQLGFLYPKSP